MSRSESSSPADKVPGITSSVIVFSTSGSRVCLIYHRRLRQWLYPGGHLRHGEDLIQCAVREVKEETGLEISLVSPTGVQIDIPPGSRAAVLAQPFAILRINDESPFTDVVFIAQAVAELPLSSNDPEVIEARWIEMDFLETLSMPAELPALIRIAHEQAALRLP